MNSGFDSWSSEAATEDGFVVLNASLIKQRLLQQGLSKRGLAELAGISPVTAGRATSSQKIQISKAHKILDALDISDPTGYFVTTTGDGSAVGTEAEQDDVLVEWQIEGMDTQEFQLSNGLTFRRYKLVHREMPGTRARGKCYDLTQLRTRDHKRVQEQLTRHPVVCRTLRGCPRIPVNERVVSNRKRDRFWIIDGWYEGVTLEEKLRYGPLSPARLPVVMKQILDGLETMHAAASLQILKRDRRDYTQRRIIRFILPNDLRGSIAFQSGKLVSLSVPSWLLIEGSLHASFSQAIL